MGFYTGLMMEQKNKAKNRYNLIVEEYGKMDISQTETYTVEIETNDIEFTIEQYCRNRNVKNIEAKLIFDDDELFGPNKSYGV